MLDDQSGKFQDGTLCRPRGTRLPFSLRPPLKRWAFLFRARGARVVLVKQWLGARG